VRSGEAINTKPLVKVIKKAEREAPEIQAEIESEGPNRWSTAVRSWVSEFQGDLRGEPLPAFDSLFKDALP
jgi:hypothetical protein